MDYVITEPVCQELVRAKAIAFEYVTVSVKRCVPWVVIVGAGRRGRVYATSLVEKAGRACLAVVCDVPLTAWSAQA